jgi:hypothetical protein
MENVNFKKEKSNKRDPSILHTSAVVQNCPKFIEKIFYDNVHIQW